MQLLKINGLIASRMGLSLRRVAFIRINNKKGSPVGKPFCIKMQSLD